MDELEDNEIECVEKEVKGVTKEVISDKNNVERVEKKTVDVPKKKCKDFAMEAEQDTRDLDTTDGDKFEDISFGLFRLMILQINNYRFTRKKTSGFKLFKFTILS